MRWAFSLFERGMLDGNLSGPWFKFIDVSTESFLSNLVTALCSLWTRVMIFEGTLYKVADLKFCGVENGLAIFSEDLVEMLELWFWK
jgi:hypothetical protein